MFEWPRVVILIVTYDRIDELARTVRAYHDNLKYPFDKLLFVIADDCSPNDYQSKVVGLWQENAYPTQCAIVTPETNSGWGVNVNNALSRFRDYPIFQCEDDYVLQKDIDLMAGVALLRKAPHVGMLRYRGTAGARYDYHQNEVDITDLYPDYFSGEGAQGKLTYLQLDHNSPTLYLYSNGPHLKSPVFHTYYGLYPEGLKLGYTEESYAHIVKDRMQAEGSPKIAILPDFVEMRFAHIGRSYQHSDLDKGVDK